MTTEEILEAMGKNPEVMSGVMKAIPTLDAGKELLENHAKMYFDKNIGPKISEIYNNIDNDIFEATGLRKKTDQKTYDFLKKDVLPELKKLKEGAPDDTEIAKKNKELEAKVKELTEAGNDDKHWHGVHIKALEAWEKKEQDYEQKIKDMNRENLNFAVSGDLETGYSKLTFDPNIPTSAIDAFKDKIKTKAIANSKIEDGKIVYLNEDGTPRVNGETFKPIDATGIFAEEMKEFISTKPASGGGAQEKGKGVVEVGEGDNKAKKVKLDPSTFDTKVGFQEKISEALTSAGVEKGSQEWNKLSDEAYVEYGVAEMNRT